MARKQGGERISEPALRALATAETLADRVILKCGQLPRPVYVEVNDVLTRLGGKWHRTGAHLFQDDPRERLAAVLALGTIPAKNLLDFFETPATLAGDLVWGNLPSDNTRVRYALEPSAGRGAIVRQVMVHAPGAQIDAVEIDPAHVTHLERLVGVQPYRVFEADFLAWAPPDGRRYDLIVMNPPFTAKGNPLAYIDHIEHAYDLLAPAGRLVSIAPGGLAFRDDRRVAAFREGVLDGPEGQIRALASDAFVESGTGVQAVVVTVEKPVAALQAAS